MQHYLQREEPTIFPHFVRPRTLLYLWLLLGLLLVGNGLILLAPLPVYASGTAVVTYWPNENEPDEMALVTLLPAEELEHLQAGQQVLVHTNNATEQVIVKVVIVEPVIASPDAIYQRFDLQGVAIAQPKAIVMAPLAPSLTNLPTGTLLGSSYAADVEIGTRQMISYLPLIGHFFTK